MKKKLCALLDYDFCSVRSGKGALCTSRDEMEPNACFEVSTVSAMPFAIASNIAWLLWCSRIQLLIRLFSTSMKMSRTPFCEHILHYDEIFKLKLSKLNAKRHENKTIALEQALGIRFQSLMDTPTRTSWLIENTEHCRILMFRGACWSFNGSEFMLTVRLKLGPLNGARSLSCK